METTHVPEIIVVGLHSNTPYLMIRLDCSCGTTLNSRQIDVREYDGLALASIKEVACTMGDEDIALFDAHVRMLEQRH